MTDEYGHYVVDVRMNDQLRSRELPATTQAAEGLPRRRWAVAEIEAIAQAGILYEHERLELIGGEPVPMSAKGVQHEILKQALNRYWVNETPDDYRVAVATTLRISEDTFFEPDFVFYRSANGLRNLNPRTALLVVELADSSLTYDLGRKTRLYASFGIREVWVIDALKQICHVHKHPRLEGYEVIEMVTREMPLSLPFAPQVAIALSRLEAD